VLKYKKLILLIISLLTFFLFSTSSGKELFEKFT